MSLPVFRRVTPSRLCVQERVGGEPNADTWSAPRPATLDDLIDAVSALNAEQRAKLCERIGLVPDRVNDRLNDAEHVLEAVEDARLAMKRLDEYRKKHPTPPEPTIPF